MARIRNLKPKFFKNGDLFDAERESGFPLRVAYAGLWCVADREGRFEWKPREIKTDVLPYDDVDMAMVLQALAKYGFIFKYKCAGKEYGFIPTFKTHQFINKNEAQSTIPAPSENSNSPSEHQSGPEIQGEYTGTSDTGLSDTRHKTQGSSAPQADAPPSKPELVVEPNKVIGTAKKQARGTRWPSEAVVSEDWIREGEMRRIEHGLAPLDLRLQAARFVNFWASKSGANATKVDWHLTWINWALDDTKGNRNGKLSAHDKGTLGAAMFLAEIEARDRARAGLGIGEAGGNLPANGHGSAQVDDFVRDIRGGFQEQDPRGDPIRLSALPDKQGK